jgi:lambda family phage tail tape measure protein
MANGEGSIGAARINLVVDASDYTSELKRAQNAAAEFGNAAEEAFGRSEGRSRSAQKRLLDYVAALGNASSEQRQFLSLLNKASGAGASDAVLKAATKGFNEYASSVELAKIKTEAWEQGQKRAMTAARGLADEVRRSGDNAAKAANERARAYVEGRATQQAANSQSQFNSLLGVNERDALAQAKRRADAEAAILPFLQQQERELEQQLALAHQINNARDEQVQRSAQLGINSQLGVTERDLAAQAQRRADAEAALLPILQKQEQELERQLQLTKQIDAARDAHVQNSAQSSINSLLGVQQPRSGQYLADQRRVVEALQAQVAAEDAVEAEAREIHRQWTAINKEVVAATSNMGHYDRARANALQQFGPVNAKPIIDQINALEKANTTIRGTTVNAKQLQQAIRFLPAQFTDIGVSLAGGMNPLLVAFQQGGQILDQFRLAGATTGDTFRMIGSYAAKLVTPITAATAVVAALAYTAYDAAKAMENLAIAGAKGFGQAGSAEQLYALTEGLNQLQNIRLGPAEEAVARLAAGGRLVGENMQLAAEATARWSSLTGEAVDQVAAQFEAIAKDPLQAIESGLVRVTEAQYNQVRALVVVGNQQEAVNLLTKIWYDTINGNSAQVESHLSSVSRVLQGIKDDFGEATRGAGDFFNNIIDNVGVTRSKLIALKGPIAALMDPSFWQADAPKVAAKTGGGTAQLFDPAAAQRAKAQALEVATYLATADENAQRQITRNRIIADGERLKIDSATTAQIIARQDKLWAAADAKKNKSGRGGTGARTAAKDVRYDYQLESALLQTQTREVQAAYAVKQITAEAYYESLIKFAKQEFDIQKRSNAEQLAAIAGKKGQEHEVARLRVADAIAEQQLAQRTIDIQSQQAQYMERLTQERFAYSNALQHNVEMQQEEYDIALKRMTIADREFERWNAENEIRREGIRLQEEVSRWAEENPNQVEEGQRRAQEALDATNAKLEQMAQAYANIDAAQADWAVGATKAWENWRDEVSDVSAHAEKVTTASLDAITDLTTDALTGNLKSWGDYFDGIAYMITQFIVKQQLTKWIESIGKSTSGNAGGGGFWGMAAGFLSGILGGAGTGGGTVASTGAGGPTVGPMFDRGGFTGHGNDNDIAGFVHKNEYVVPAPVVRAIRSGRSMGAGGATSAARGPVTIIQNNSFPLASDRTTREQYLRGQAKQTNKALAKV